MRINADIQLLRVKTVRVDGSLYQKYSQLKVEQCYETLAVQKIKWRCSLITAKKNTWENAVKIWHLTSSTVYSDNSGNLSIWIRYLSLIPCHTKQLRNILLQLKKRHVFSFWFPWISVTIPYRHFHGHVNFSHFRIACYSLQNQRPFKPLSKQKDVKTLFETAFHSPWLRFARLSINIIRKKTSYASALAAFVTHESVIFQI